MSGDEEEVEVEGFTALVSLVAHIQTEGSEQQAAERDSIRPTTRSAGQALPGLTMNHNETRR